MQIPQNTTPSKKPKVTQEHLSDLEELLPGRVTRDVDLSEISRWRVGGVARVVVQPNGTDELSRLRGWVHQRSLPSVIIGGTTNLLFADEGLDAIAIQLEPSVTDVDIKETLVSVSASVWVPALVRKSISAGLTGIEHACGIPGTLGGLICMNGGSQRKGIGDSVRSVTSVRDDGTIKTRVAAECGFSYRTSIYQSNNEVISSATLHLVKSASPRSLRQEVLEILRSRREKFPQKLPNCGSVFVSDPSMYKRYGPPGKVIEEMGLKGLTSGNASISHQHANFIVNNGGATAREIIYLINKTREQVFVKTGYLMKVEARYVTKDGRIVEI